MREVDDHGGGDMLNMFEYVTYEACAMSTCYIRNGQREHVTELPRDVTTPDKYHCTACADSLQMNWLSRLEHWQYSVTKEKPDDQSFGGK
ncbi:hypothetical protein DFA_03748 [Cavenderia fasciculata]|uniref:Uncharacterized protein n=1 Tax=Cavenderia fasciculata TaxID=261658 RepID=F4Q0A6_CACFS|nr:uncharacterized protein DFA_03748 [Cavenderia fasciculata]EGG18257.1 hypothetical protein DFA_03748 [Cavenderia fasciculata]|eukprot:XP_004357080.1 hypothetical protein DFA_03748 [Cavenderia fasciculata]